MEKKKLILLIPIIIVLIVIFSVVNIQTNKPNNKIKVVAVENVYADIASQIGGNRVEIYSILKNPNADPHEYESTFNDTKKIKDADLIIKNGLGYDSFIDKLLDSSDNKSLNIIDLGEKEKLTDKDNPHLWYRLSYMKDLANSIRDHLNAQDASGTNYYNDNYNKFLISLNPIINSCNIIKSRYTDTPVIYTERVAEYIIKDCGLKNIHSDFSKSIEEGTDPSINTINNFKTIIINREVKLLFYNSQTISHITEDIQKLAKDNNIPIIGVSESIPENKDYQIWISHTLDEINNKLAKE